jgi:hypothetical protein
MSVSTLSYKQYKSALTDLSRKWVYQRVSSNI